jgi:hypothetical protein
MGKWVKLKQEFCGPGPVKAPVKLKLDTPGKPPFVRI